MHKSSDCSVVIVYVLKWWGSSYVEKGGGLLKSFSRGPWIPRLDCGNHHSLWWVPRSNHGIFSMASLHGFFGSGHHRWPVVSCTARGDLVFSCSPEGVPIFMPLQFCTRQSYPDRCLFRHFQPLFLEGEGTQSQEWNLSECLQHPLDYLWETQKTHLVKLISYP